MRIPRIYNSVIYSHCQMPTESTVEEILFYANLFNFVYTHAQRLSLQLMKWRKEAAS